MQNGYYYAVVKEVTVECYEPPSDAASTSGSKSYVYTNTEALEKDVAITNDNTILGSFLADGNKPDYNPSASTGANQPTQTPETVPGISGGGSQQVDGGDTSASASGPAGSSPTGGGSGGFTQGNDASTVVAGSAVALLGFFVAALML